jgi:hypothetical protein
MRPLRAAIAIGMTLLAAPPASLLLAPGPAAAGATIAVVEERQVPESNGKAVHHLAVLRNTGSVPVRGLRVTVELQDHFGKLLWAKTVGPTPSTIQPGETALVRVTAPRLGDQSRTRYRFHSSEAATH